MIFVCCAYSKLFAHSTFQTGWGGGNETLEKLQNANKTSYLKALVTGDTVMDCEKGILKKQSQFEEKRFSRSWDI